MLNENINENTMVELNDEELDAVSGGKRKQYIEGDDGKSNIRKGPGLKYKSLGTLHRGEQVRFKGNTSVDDRGVVWYNVDYEGRDAWVSSRYTVVVSY